MPPTADSRSPGPPTARRLQVRLPVLLLLVAVVAVVLAAWRYSRDHNDIQHAWTNIQLHQLSRGDALERRQAADLISRAWVDDLPLVVSSLTDTLRHRDWEVRRSAARAIGMVIVRNAAGRSGNVDPAMDLATTALINALRDPRPEVRAEAAQALGTLREDVQVTPPALGVPSTTVAIGPPPSRAVPALLAVVRDPEASVRVEAVRALGRVAPKTDDAPAALVAILVDDPAPEVRAGAARALAQPWRNADQHYPLLFRRLAEAPTQEERFAISMGLQRLLVSHPRTFPVPLLIDALRRDDPSVRWSIATALRMHAFGAQASLPELVKVARDQLESETEGWSAAEAIFAIDRDSPEARYVLWKLTLMLESEEDGPRRLAAAWFLVKYGSPAAMEAPEPRGDLGSDDRAVPQLAFDLLVQSGPAALFALPDLAAIAREELDRGTVGLRATRAAFALDGGRGTPDARSLLLPLAEVMWNHPDGQMRIEAAEIFRSAYMNDNGTIATIRDARKDADPEIRALAESVLRWIDSQPAAPGADPDHGHRGEPREDTRD